MSKKQTIFVRVLGGVAEVDWTTVPKNVEVEILDFDEIEGSGDSYIKKLSVEARRYAKARGYI